RFRSWGLTAVRGRSVAPDSAGSSPSTRTAPASGVLKPSQISTVVVLPAPFGPSTASRPPRGRSRSMLSTAVTVGYRLTIPDTCTALSLTTTQNTMCAQPPVHAVPPRPGPAAPGWRPGAVATDGTSGAPLPVGVAAVAVGAVATAATPDAATAVAVSRHRRRRDRQGKPAPRRRCAPRTCRPWETRGTPEPH